MYKLTEQGIFILKMYKRVMIANAVGVTQNTMSHIYKGNECRKVVAYAIVKYIDPELEIEDLFEQVR